MTVTNDLTFELSRSACGAALHIHCACCGERHEVAAVGREFKDYARKATLAFMTTGRCGGAGLSDRRTTVAALASLDEALDDGAVAELAPGESRVVHAADYWRHLLAHLKTVERSDRAARAACFDLADQGLLEARSWNPADASAGGP